jgi:hypothetical protein
MRRGLDVGVFVAAFVLRVVVGLCAGGVLHASENVSFDGPDMGAGGGMAIGDPVAACTPNSVLYCDAAGDLAQSNPGFTYDEATDVFTVAGNVTVEKAGANTTVTLANTANEVPKISFTEGGVEGSSVRYGGSTNPGVPEWRRKLVLMGGNQPTSGVVMGTVADLAGGQNVLRIADNWGGTPVDWVTVGGDGLFTANGNVIVGDAAGDTVTSNAAAWTFANDTTVALSGGVDGLNIDSNTLSIDAASNRVGIGTPAPTQALDVTGTILSGVQLKTSDPGPTGLAAPVNNQYPLSVAGAESGGAIYGGMSVRIDSVFGARLASYTGFGTPAAPTNIPANQPIGLMLSYWGWTGAAQGFAGDIRYVGQENWVPGSTGSRVEVRTILRGSTTQTVPLRIGGDASASLCGSRLSVLQATNSTCNSGASYIADQNNGGVEARWFMGPNFATTQSSPVFMGPANNQGIYFPSTEIVGIAGAGPSGSNGIAEFSDSTTDVAVTAALRLRTPDQTIGNGNDRAIHMDWASDTNSWMVLANGAGSGSGDVAPIIRTRADGTVSTAGLNISAGIAANDTGTEPVFVDTCQVETGTVTSPSAAAVTNRSCKAFRNLATNLMVIHHQGRTAHAESTLQTPGASQNDYTGCNHFEVCSIAPTASINITGLTHNMSGLSVSEQLTMCNTAAIGSGFNLTLTDEDGASTANRRFAFSASTAKVLVPRSCILLRYNQDIDRWMAVGPPS